MKPSELKAAILAADPESHFFDRRTMAFFGDRMLNYGVRSVTVRTEYDAAGNYCREGLTVEAWELYRRRPVKHGLQTSHYFAKNDARHLSPVN